MSARLAVLLLFGALAIAGCRQSEPAPKPTKSPEEVTREIETLSVPHPPAPRKAPDFLLQVLPLPDIMAFAGDRPACLLFGDKGVLFVSNGPDGLARSANASVRMGADAPVGPTGGFFRSQGGSLSIGRIGQYSAGAEPYALAWTVEAAVRGSGAARPQIFHARWTCRKRISPELVSSGP